MCYCARGSQRLQRRRTREHRIAREQASAEVARKASDEAAAAARKREIETKASVMKDLLGTVRIGPACLCACVCVVVHV